MNIESEPEILHHSNLPIEAPRAVWAAAKFTTYSNSDKVGPRSWGDNGFDALLVVAMGHGKGGAEAIAFAIEEEMRLSADKTRSTAIARLGDALMACSQSLKPLDVRVVVEGIMSGMQERFPQFRK